MGGGTDEFDDRTPSGSTLTPSGRFPPRGLLALLRSRVAIRFRWFRNPSAVHWEPTLSFARAVVRSSLAALVAVTCSAVSRSVAAQTAPAPALAPAATARAPRPGPGASLRNPRLYAGGRAGNALPCRCPRRRQLGPARTLLDRQPARPCGRAGLRHRARDVLQSFAGHAAAESRCTSGRTSLRRASPRRDPVPITGGVTLSGVKAGGQALRADHAGTARAAVLAGAPSPGYLVQGTVMWIQLAHAASARRQRAASTFAWSYSPPPVARRTGARGATGTSSSWATGILSSPSTTT